VRSRKRPWGRTLSGGGHPRTTLPAQHPSEEPAVPEAVIVAATARSATRSLHRRARPDDPHQRPAHQGQDDRPGDHVRRRRPGHGHADRAPEL